MSAKGASGRSGGTGTSAGSASGSGGNSNNSVNPPVSTATAGQDRGTTGTGSKPKPSGSTAPTHCLTKRIIKEMTEFREDPPPNCTAGPKKEDNLYEWEATIKGPTGSVYEGGVFHLDIQLTTNYPFVAPKVTFRTKIYHCNVNSQGLVCVDILKNSHGGNSWSPALRISKLLLSITSLLSDCNPADPLVGSIATQYLKNREEHDRTAREWTERYAKEN